MPETRTIPIFALGVEKGREAVEQVVLTGHAAVKKVVGGNAARELCAGRYGAHHILHERRRLGRQTAIYSTCLAFAEAEHAQAFGRDNPEVGLHAFEQQTVAALLECDERLRDRLTSGRFELRPLDEKSRLK